MSRFLSTAVIIAPAHDNLDRRVLRTLEAYCNAGVKTSLFLEEERVTQDLKTSLLLPICLYKRIPIQHLIFGNLKYNNNLLSSIINASIIHVHDSGIYGLLLSKKIISLNKNCKLIYDYHDWIEWEIPYQLSKFIANTAAVKSISKIIAIIIYRYFKNINIHAIVGISLRQLCNISHKLHIDDKIKWLVIPNTRPDFIKNATDDNAASDKINLMWVGNLGAGRSIEHSFECIYSKLEVLSKSFDIKCYSIGKRWGSFSIEFDDKVTHLGGYTNEENIIKKTPIGKNVGLFFGWDDKWDTGINSIASPNKLYTYIFLEWPFLIPNTLEDFICDCAIPDIFIYNTFDDFIEKLKYIASNYKESLYLVKKLKLSIKKEDDCLLELDNLIMNVIAEQNV